MSDHPEGETRSDRVRAWIVGLAAVLVVLSLAIILVLGLIIWSSGNNHHAATVKQNAKIEFLLKEVKTAQADGHSKLNDLGVIEMQVAGVIEGLPSADAALGKFAQWLEICVGEDHEVGCPAPPIPTS